MKIVRGRDGNHFIRISAPQRCQIVVGSVTMTCHYYLDDCVDGAKTNGLFDDIDSCMLNRRFQIHTIYTPMKAKAIEGHLNETSPYTST